MAMFPRRDRSAYYSSLQSNTQMAGSLAGARIIANNAKNDTTLLKKKMQEQEADFQLDMQTAENVVGGLVNLVYSGVSGDLSPIVGEKINSLIQNSQIEKGNAALLPILTEGDGIAKRSLADGSSYFDQIETEDGLQTIFVPSQSLKDWYDESIAAIDEMRLLPNVKSQLKAKVANSYYASVQSLQGAAIEQAYTDLQDAYATNLEGALVSDAALWAEYGGKLPEGVRYSGLSTIAGRSDFSAERKKIEVANYMKNVRYLGVQDKAAEIARSGGMAEVDRYLQEQAFLTPQERNSIYAMAQTSYSQMKGSYTDEAGNLMAEAFTDMGSTPYQIYEEINNVAHAMGLPDDVRLGMIETARSEQRTAVQTMVSNQLQMDAGEGYSAYTKTLEYLESGGADSWFYGLPEEKASAISQYKAKIQEIEENVATALNTTTETIQKADKEILTGYQAGLDNDWDLFSSGAYTGEEYLQAVTDRTIAARKEIGLPETDESIIAAQAVAMDKVMGYIPTAMQSDIKSAVSSLMVAEGLIQSQTSKRTPEELAALNKVITQANGAIADAIFQYGVKAVGTPEDIYNFANQTVQAFILQNEVLGSDGISDIPLLDEPGVTMKKAVTAAVDTNNAIVEADETNYIYLDHSAGYEAVGLQDENGNTVGFVSRYLASGEIEAFPEYRFLSIEAQEDYERRTDVFESLLVPALNKSGVNITKTDIHSMPEASKSGNTAIASPIMFADGRVFRVRGQEIQETTDGNIWTTFATFSKSGDVSPVNIQERPSVPSQTAWLDENTIGNYVKPVYEMTGRGRQVTGISIDPAIFSLPNYTKTDAINLVKESPDLQQFWQMFASDIGRMERENKGDNQ